MKKNNELWVSLSTQKIDKNEKGIWAKISYRETKTTIPQFINYIGEGYAFAHLFVHSNETFNYKERLNNNFRGSQIVAIDIDHTTISFGEFNDMMVQTEIQPTITYTTQNNGVKGNRYRALYIINEIVNADTYKELYSHLTNEIVSYFDSCAIEIDNNANKLNQQFAGNGTTNFEYCESEVYNIEWLLQRYDITMSNNLNLESNIKVHDRYIIKQEEGGQSGYIISHNNNNGKPHGGYIISHENISSSSNNNHYNINNDINKHGRYIEYLINKKLNNEKPHGGYIISNNIKKEEEHYITMLRFLKEIDSNEFINDYYTISISNIIEKYLTTFPSYEFTNIEYDITQPYYLVPDDYIEIKRKWHFREFEKDDGRTYRVTEIEKCKNGQGRRRRLFINLIIRRLIYPQISFEHLLYNCLYELHRYIDNNDKEDEITKRDIAEISINAYFEDLNKWSKLKDYHKPKFKINKEYCTANNINARRMALKINAERNKQAKKLRDNEIAKYYNPKLKEKDNIKVLQENGLNISLRVLQKWKKENGYTKSKKTKQTINANKAILSNNNKMMEQQHTNDKKASQGANVAIVDKKRESENNTIKVMLNGSVREVTLTELRSELFNDTLLTLTNNIIGVRAYELDDDLRFTMAVINSNFKPSFIVTNKKDDVICFYACDSELNDNEYKTLSNEICNDLKTCINEFAIERIVSVVNGYEYERGENFGCINNEIIYNTQWLLNRYSIIKESNEKVRDGYIISQDDDEVNNYSPTYFNNDFWNNKDVLI